MGRSSPTLTRINWKNFGNAWKQPEHVLAHTSANPGMAAAEAADEQHICPNAKPPRRPAPAHRLREREVPEPLGVLEQRDGDIHDWRRSLHARVQILRGHDSETDGARSGRAGKSGGSDS